MPPSFPDFECVSDLAVQFVVPDRPIIHKILWDSEEDERLHLKAGANLLLPQIKILARLMSRHRIQVDRFGEFELSITLFLPPPPCPPPKSSAITSAKNVVGEWITLYEYVPCMLL